MLYINCLQCKPLYNIYGRHVIYVADKQQWFSFLLIARRWRIPMSSYIDIRDMLFSKTWNTTTLVLSTGIRKHIPLRINSWSQCLCYFLECIWLMSWRSYERKPMFVLLFWMYMINIMTCKWTNESTDLIVEVLCSIPQIICSKRSKMRNWPVMTEYTKYEWSLRNSLLQIIKHNNLCQC
jgi:hypothetical protein